jgi:hypothetical protein
MEKRETMNFWYCSKRADGECEFCIVCLDKDAPSYCLKCGANMIKYERRYLVKARGVSWFGFGGRR